MDCLGVPKGWIGKHWSRGTMDKVHRSCIQPFATNSADGLVIPNDPDKRIILKPGLVLEHYNVYMNIHQLIYNMGEVNSEWTTDT